jgi:hypothetical protein
MKFIRLSVGFLIGSLFQGFIVYIGKRFGFSQFDIQFTVMRIIHHIVVGQASGYVLLWFITHMDNLKRIPALILSSLFGVLTWGIVMFTGTHTGLIQPGWLQSGGIATTLAAFVVYGLIAGMTIWRWGLSHGRVERNRNR